MIHSVRNVAEERCESTVECIRREAEAAKAVGATCHYDGNQDSALLNPVPGWARCVPRLPDRLITGTDCAKGY